MTPSSGHSYTEASHCAQSNTMTLRAHRRTACVVAALASLASAATAAAQDARERAVYVTVVDRAGNPVDGLDQRAFTVREDGAPREILRVAPATDPIDVALLLDTSSAVEPYLIHLRRAVSTLIDGLPSTARIALIGLGARPTILADYTADRARLHVIADGLFPQSGSGMTLLDALIETSKGLERREAPRAALVALITDGPEIGQYDDGTVVKAIARAGAALHAVGVGQFTMNGEDTVRYRSIVLARGTERSGGRYRTLLAPTGWPQALQQVARELSSQYKVVYARPASLIPPDTVSVSIQGRGLVARATPERGREQ